MIKKMERRKMIRRNKKLAKMRELRRKE